jgi:hypothetical protein
MVPAASLAQCDMRRIDTVYAKRGLSPAAVLRAYGHLNYKNISTKF